MFAQLELVKPVRQMLVCFPLDTEVKVVGMANVQRGTSHVYNRPEIFLNIFFILDAAKYVFQSRK